MTPYFIKGILELPLTTTQDYSLFHILQEYSTRLWEDQVDRILQYNGLISFNIHPDYIIEQRAQGVYLSLLSKLADIRTNRNVWTVLPREVNHWWRQRAGLELVEHNGAWQIVGDGNKRASVAYASIRDDRVVYTFDT